MNIVISLLILSRITRIHAPKPIYTHHQITIEDVSESVSVVFPVAKAIDAKPTRLTGKEEIIGEEARKKTMRSTLKPIQYEVCMSERVSGKFLI